MTADLLDDHAQAVLALLRANSVLEGIVFDGQVPDGPPPKYVVVYIHFTSPKGAVGDNLAEKSITLTTWITAHCVGSTAASARAMSSRARDALLNARPSVAGRTSELIGLDAAPPPQSDETTGVQVMDSVNVFRFTSYPA